MTQLCFGCFSTVSKDGACPVCGYDPREDLGKYPSALAPGSILKDRYILGRVLGQGGFGITYAAQDFETKQRVAIKEFMPSSIASRESNGQVSSYGSQQDNFQHGKESFVDEANALVNLKDNPHIVNILDFFEQNGTAYFVMEFVQGTNLKSYIKVMGGRLGEEEANRILLPIMEALEDVHAKGLVHRDIAPDNIIVTSDGSAKLIDFGAARYSTGEKSLSLDVVLKHGYAPVEQYARRGRQGPFTDVYAMAATYYYAVTGRVPQDSIERMTADSLLSPSAMGIKLSPHTEDALFKAMEVQYINRFKTMGEFVAALKGIAPVSTQVQPEQERANAGEQQTNPFLAKAESCLKEGKWEQTTLLCDTVLETEPSNAQAQLIKSMAGLRVTNREDFAKAMEKMAAKPRKAHPNSVPEKKQPSKGGGKKKKSIPVIAAILAVLVIGAAFAFKGGVLSGGGESSPKNMTSAPAEAPSEGETPAENGAEEQPSDIYDSIPDEVVSADGKYELAFIADGTLLKDISYNENVWNGVKSFAAQNGISYKYYLQGSDLPTDDERYDVFAEAVAKGASVIVTQSFMNGIALERAAAEFKNVEFVFVDGWVLDGQNNVTAVCFSEEQSGFLAGYALVKEGYTKLGFCGAGGGYNPACSRYGYGFVQGASYAAAILGITVDVNYSWLYGEVFSASPELQELARGWYMDGTEAIFACGGYMYMSVVAAATELGGAVIGTDVDQSYVSEAFITSAMKDMTAGTMWTLEKLFSGNAGELRGKTLILGAAEEAVCLPEETWSFVNFTKDEYRSLLIDIATGVISVDSDYSLLSATPSLNLNIVE